MSLFFENKIFIINKCGPCISARMRFHLNDTTCFFYFEKVLESSLIFVLFLKEKKKWLLKEKRVYKKLSLSLEVGLPIGKVR